MSHRSHHSSSSSSRRRHVEHDKQQRASSHVERRHEQHKRARDDDADDDYDYDERVPRRSGDTPLKENQQPVVDDVDDAANSEKDYSALLQKYRKLKQLRTTDAERLAAEQVANARARASAADALVTSLRADVAAARADAAATRARLTFLTQLCGVSVDEIADGGARFELSLDVRDARTPLRFALRVDPAATTAAAASTTTSTTTAAAAGSNDVDYRPHNVARLMRELHRPVPDCLADEMTFDRADLPTFLVKLLSSVEPDDDDDDDNDDDNANSNDT